MQHWHGGLLWCRCMAPAAEHVCVLSETFRVFGGLQQGTAAGACITIVLLFAVDCAFRTVATLQGRGMSALAALCRWAVQCAVRAGIACQCACLDAARGRAVHVVFVKVATIGVRQS